MLSAGDVFYDCKFYHKKCDPLPDAKCLGVVPNLVTSAKANLSEAKIEMTM